MLCNRFFVGAMAMAAFVGAGNALAGTPPGTPGQVTLNFIELDNEAGIALTGFDFTGAAINAPTLTGEIYHVGVPFTGNNNPTPDFRLNHIGFTHNPLAYLLVNILENDGTLSDQIFVYKDSGSNTHIDFISDPAMFSTLNPTGILTETGTLQPGLTYTSDTPSPVIINFQSDIDVPAPGAVAMLGLGGLLAARRRRA